MSEQKMYEIGGEKITFPHPIILEYPITISPEEILTEIEFEDAPTWSDMGLIKSNEDGKITMDMYIPLVSKLSAVSIISIKRIKSMDAVKIMGFLTPFLA